uniref:Uncharacterized protein n=1 Tax=Arundo donax TaxID=35708 RepID=A0A0A9EVC1_ARUDO
MLFCRIEWVIVSVKTSVTLPTDCSHHSTTDKRFNQTSNPQIKNSLIYQLIQYKLPYFHNNPFCF